MTAFNTGNPIGSTNPKDLYDNAQNLDVLVNSNTDVSHADRLGVQRKTWHGMEAEFDAEQAQRSSEFAQFLADSAYQDLGVYGAGIEVTRYNQVFLKDGEFYRAAASLVLPYTTTGVWVSESASFVGVGDAVLRSDLAATSGAALVGADDGAGGSLFTTAAGFISRLMSSAGSAIVGFIQAGTGAVQRTAQDKLRESVSVRDFGAVGDGVTDDAPAIQAAIDYAETIGASVYLPAGIYGIGSTVYVCQTAAIRLFGDGIRVSVLKKLADVTGLIVPKTGVPNGIIEDFKIEGRGGSNPALNTTENTAGLICYVKMERANLFIQYCGGPAFTDPYPNTTGTTAGRRSYAAALLNDTSNTNNTKDFQIFAANCCGDALYVGVVSGTRDCNGMDVSVRSFQCTGFAINAQKGFRNRFKILSAQGQFHIGVCLAADTDNVFDIQYVESGDFTLGAQAEAARNEFNFYDSTGIATPYSFNNTNNIWRDIATRREHFGGTPVAQVSGTAPAFMGGVRIGGNATANRIDLYETGVWTATLYDASSGGNASATTVTGHYVQIGNLLVCSFINLNNIDTTGMTPGNTLHISLPKAAASDAAKITSGTVVLDSIAFPAGTTSPTCSPVQNTSRAVIQCSGTGVADALLTVGGLTSGTSDIVRFTLSYFV